MNSRKFADRVVIVTASSSGIGRATALAFGREGARVVVACRRHQEGEETVRQIEASGGTARFIRTDVSRAADVATLVRETVEHFGRLDFAFNNAGVAEAPMAFSDQTEDAFDAVMNVTVKGTWLCMRAEAPAILRSGGGAIVNMASIAAVVGSQGAPIYAAAKHAVVGLTKSAALEYAKRGLRVNAVCPGVIETPSIEQYCVQSPALKARLLSAHPAGRFGTPEEVAAAVLWLCSPETGFMTGHSLVIDGGYTIQ